MWQCVAGGSGRSNECAYDAGSPRGSVSLVGVPPDNEDALEAALGLGDLAGLTVNNEADTICYDVRMARPLCRIM